VNIKRNIRKAVPAQPLENGAEKDISGSWTLLSATDSSRNFGKISTLYFPLLVYFTPLPPDVVGEAFDEARDRILNF
jgi:hypothetical protein